MAERPNGYEDSMAPSEWEYLCTFLAMDLNDVMKLSGPDLLKATVVEIKRRDLRKRGHQV